MKKLSFLSIMLAGILWGCIGIFVRGLNKAGVQSMEIVEIRGIVTFAFLLLGIICYNRRLLYIKWKDLWCFLGTGIGSILFFNFCYFQTMKMTTLSVAAILLYTAPVFVAGLSTILFHERITRFQVLSIILIIAGCTMVSGGLNGARGISLESLMWGLGAGLGYALYSIFSRYALERGYHTLTITLYTFGIVAFACLFLCDNRIILGKLSGNKELVLLCLGLGLFSTVIPYLSYTYGLKQIENTKASVIASIEPVTATILGVILYQEKLTVGNVIGMLCVFAGVAIVGRRQKLK